MATNVSSSVVMISLTSHFARSQPGTPAQTAPAPAAAASISGTSAIAGRPMFRPTQVPAMAPT